MSPHSGILRRYPGLRPFERAQSALFHGRRQDIFRLSNLVMHSRLSVLFAKSGIGKTSLLEAGVAPELEARRFTPIYIRINNSDASILETVRATLCAHPSRTGEEEAYIQPNMPPTLWELLKRLEFDVTGLPATPVLVLDQFEELFTLAHSDRSRAEFVSQLADLANEVMPESVRQVLRAGLRQTDAKAKLWWERQPDLRIVISIRSDFLHALDELSPQIPGILSERYQLLPLNAAQALEAIEQPARAQGDFVCPPFAFSQEALDQLCHFLAGFQSETGSPAQGGGEIESFHLQILCRHIEEKIINDNLPADYVVEPAFYESTEGLAREINQFYERQITGLPEIYARRTGAPAAEPDALRATARLLIEESLVTPNDRRCSMVDDYLMNAWGVDIALLDAMVETRLLRKENRLGDAYYEISHDTLLPAVIASRNARRLLEQREKEKAAYEARLAFEAQQRRQVEQELRSMRDKRRTARRLAMTSLAALLFTLASFYLFLRNWYDNIRNELAQAESAVHAEQFEAAENAYQNLRNKSYKRHLLERFPPNKRLDEELAQLRLLQEAYLVQSDYMDKGDSLYFAEDFAAALAAYRRGLVALAEYQAMNLRIPAGDSLMWRINPAKIADRRSAFDLRAESAYKTLRTKFDIQQRKYEDFVEARAWNFALSLAESMERLLPTHADDLARLKDDLSLSLSPEQYVQREKARLQNMLRR